MKSCKLCGKEMPNAHPNKKFCCNKHKDRFHNIHNPRGIYSHLADKKDDCSPESIEDSIHPQDPDALGQE